VLTARDRNFAGDSSLKVALIPLMGDVLGQELIETLGRKRIHRSNAPKQFRAMATR
jgi:hypothetical protein